jgi:arylsulfatase A-like enzyme
MRGAQERTADTVGGSTPYAKVRANSAPLADNGNFQSRPHHIGRRSFLAAVVGALASPAIARHRDNHLPPNIVLMTVDDLFDVDRGRTRFGVTLHTPGFDRLKANGVTFTNAYASTAVCGPSRAAMVSGMNPLRIGVHTNADVWFEHVNPLATFPAMMKERRGYHVYSFGKVTHPANGTERIWTDSGIAEIDFRVGKADQEVVARLLDELPGLQEPWLLMVGLSNPHYPYESPPEFYEGLPLSDIRPLDWQGDEPPPEIADNQREDFAALQAAGEERDFIRDYLANVHEADFYIRRVTSRLFDMTPQPHILLTGDHGFMLGEVEAVSKFTAWETAALTPFIWLLDVAPTILEWAGLPKPERMDGESRAAAVLDPSLRWQGEALTTMIARGAGIPDVMNYSLRTEDWRVALYNEVEPPYVELFRGEDLESRNNLSDHAQFAETREELLRQMRRKISEWRE